VSAERKKMATPKPTADSSMSGAAGRATGRYRLPARSPPD
jgi:hypothetical protein